MSFQSESSDLREWRNHFPYPTPRDYQAEALDQIAQNWNRYDVFILQAPTAFGKSSCARTLMSALHSVSYITPTNQLVDQFLTEFPETPTLSRMDGYWCEEWKRPCPATRARLKKFCSGCSCAKQLATAKYRRGPGVYNYHIYTSHKIFRNTLIVDECQNMIPFIRERMSIQLWQHDLGYPHNAWKNEQILEWVNTLADQKRKQKKIQLLRDALTSRSPKYIVSRGLAEFNGKGTRRGFPEERDCIRLLPVDISSAPPIFWNSDVKKLVLLSATIGPKDVDILGLGKFGRVCYINCRSPIPPEQKPIIYDPLISVNRENLESATQDIARYLEEVILPLHSNEKGIVHATYGMAKLLSTYLASNRFIFHDAGNKKQKYEEFRSSRAESGKILIASGMYEGIDLPGDLGRFQVIAKVPWMSLGNPAIQYMAEQDEEWFTWEAVKSLVQAAGRICRTPDDFGTTYLIDKSFNRVLEHSKHLLPQPFLDSLQVVE